MEVPDPQRFTKFWWKHRHRSKFVDIYYRRDHFIPSFPAIVGDESSRIVERLARRDAFEGWGQGAPTPMLSVCTQTVRSLS